MGLPTGAFMNAEAIYKYLLSIGLSTNAAAGVAGNIYQESHGNPRSSSSAGGGLFGLTIQNGGSVNGGSLQQELLLLKKYIATNGSVGDINAHASSPSAAAAWFSQKYERPGIPDLSTREAAADWVAQSAKSGNWGSSKGTSGGTPSSGGTSPSPSGFDWITGALDPLSGFDWIGKGISGVTGTFSNVGDVAKAISGAVTEFSMIIKWVSWLFQPANWVRIIAANIGIMMVVAGSIMMVVAAK
jgi:Phage tail lysozyme